MRTTTWWDCWWLRLLNVIALDIVDYCWGCLTTYAVEMELSWTFVTVQNLSSLAKTLTQALSKILIICGSQQQRPRRVANFLWYRWGHIRTILCIFCIFICWIQNNNFWTWIISSNWQILRNVLSCPFLIFGQCYDKRTLFLRVLSRTASFGLLLGRFAFMCRWLENRRIICLGISPHITVLRCF